MNVIEEIRSIVEQSKTWLKLEAEYYRLTVAEKLTLLISSLVIGFVCLLLSVVVLILLAFSLAELYKLMMCPSLAYLSTAGSILVLLVILFLLRKPLLQTPISKLITKVFFDKKN